MDRIDGKWIHFVLLFQKPKTQIWQVVATINLQILGDIKWYTPWRTYTFFPLNNTIYEDDCLTEIAGFIKKLMAERKK